MDISVQSGTIVYDVGFEKGYKLIRDAGFTAIDWNIDNALTGARLKEAAATNSLKDICIFERSLDEVLEYYAEELSCIRANGLKITQAHCPFPPYYTGREDVLDYCIGIYKRVIELCDAVDCKNLIVHGISLDPIDPANDDPARIKELNMKLYSSLIDTLKKTNVTVCLENLFKTKKNDFYQGICSDPHEAVEYIDTLNALAGKECFGLCLDTGHLHLLRGRFGVYAPILGKRIKALHIHDNDAIYDKHTAPYSGTIIWQEFIEAMRQIEYDHDLSFETFRQTSPQWTDPELVPTFLKLIYDIGLFFRKKITE